MSTSTGSDQHQQQTLDAILDAALDELDENDKIPDDSAEAEKEYITGAMAAEIDAAVDELDENDKNPDNTALDMEESATSTMATENAASKSDVEDTSPAVDIPDSEERQYVPGGMISKEEEEEAAAMLESLMKQLQSDFGSEIATEATTTKSEESTKKQPASNANNSTTKADPNVNSTIESLLENMAKQPDDTATPSEQAMLEEMMREFEQFMPSDSNAGTGDPTDALVNGMMQQLLSKELMYEPMVQVCNKFPTWLQRNEGEMTKEEYKRYVEWLLVMGSCLLYNETETDAFCVF